MPQPQTGIHGPLLLEEPLIRTPFELLRRSHRSAQRQVERDFVFVQSQLNNLLKSFSGDPDKDRDPALAKLDAAAERVRGLKRKLDDLQPAASAPNVLRDRLAHVEDTLLPQAEMGGAKGLEGVDRTLDRYIVDHLLRTGRMKTARTLTATQGIENLVDVKLFAELVKIETALVEKHSCAEGLAWCGENRGTLKKLGSDLEFSLRFQEYIELCRKRDYQPAIAYAVKYLAPWGSTHMAQLQRAMTMPAFGERTGVSVYKKLYDPARWTEVRDQFRETFLGIYALPSQSLLALSLSAGLSSLRLPACTEPAPSNGGTKTSEATETRKKPAPLPSSHTARLPPPSPLLPPAQDLHAVMGLDSLASPELDLTGTREAAAREMIPSASAEEAHAHGHPHPREAASANVDCPTCAEDMRVLAREVAMAHHVNSTLVCRISGDVMDSNNEPMAFPNGCVYSSKALAEMAKNNFDVVTCPRTNETCAFSRLRKVYIS